MPRPDSFPRSRAFYWTFASGLFLYLVFVRTRDITRTFWLGSDEILYWRIALGPLRDLPLGGGPSSMGGSTLGPVFSWLQWLFRHLIGPWTDNLPHAGAIGQAILQSAADVLLCFAVWRRTDNAALALGTVLLIATAPLDMALTATIWNPPVAVAFVKLSIALALAGADREQAGWAAAAAATALLGVQAHSSAIFFAAPLVASFAAAPIAERRWTRAVQVSAAMAAAILFVEIPYLLDYVRHPNTDRSPTIVVNNLSYTLSHPWTLRIGASFRALSSGCAYILLRPWSLRGFGVLLSVCAVVTAIRLRRQIVVLGATVGPLVCAGFGFSVWQQAFDNYWYLTVAPSAALTIAWAATAWRPAERSVSRGLLALALLTQPWRVADALTINRLPEYGAFVRGSRQARRYAPELRNVETEFPLPPYTEAEFLYRILGGRVNPASPFTARIARTGAVTFTAAGTDSTIRVDR